MQEPFDILIHGGTIVTVNPAFDIVEDGMLGIVKDRIAAVATVPESDRLPPADRYIDAAGCLVIPGLVNTHTHLPMSLFRGLADDLPLHEWLHDHIFPAEARFIDEKSVCSGTRLSCAELILSGTTTCCDGYFYESEVAEPESGWVSARTAVPAITTLICSRPWICAPNCTRSTPGTRQP